MATPQSRHGPNVVALFVPLDDNSEFARRFHTRILARAKTQTKSGDSRPGCPVEQSSTTTSVQRSLSCRAEQGGPKGLPAHSKHPYKLTGCVSGFHAHGRAEEITRFQANGILAARSGNVPCTRLAFPKPPLILLPPRFPNIFCRYYRNKDEEVGHFPRFPRRPCCDL